MLGGESRHGAQEVLGCLSEIPLVSRNKSAQDQFKQETFMGVMLGQLLECKVGEATWGSRRNEPGTEQW